MAKEKKSDAKSEDETRSPFRKERIAIFIRNYNETISHSCHIQSWKQWAANQIVRKEEDIERLIKMKAPIEIYLKDVYEPTENRH